MRCTNLLPSYCRVSKLHSLSCRVCHLKSWRSCSFSPPDFLGKTQNLFVYDLRFEEFTLPYLADFMDKERGEMLLCPVRSLKRYLRKIEQLRHEHSAVLVSATKERNRCLGAPFCFGLDWRFPMHISQPLMRTAGQSRLRSTRYGRLMPLFSSKITVQSSRY